MTFFVLGNEDVVLGFRYIGIKGEIIEDQQSACDKFIELTQNPHNIGIIILTEQVSAYLGEILIDWQHLAKYPLIVEIPDMSGHLPEHKTLLDSIREAVGVHL